LTAAHAIGVEQRAEAGQQAGLQQGIDAGDDISLVDAQGFGNDLERPLADRKSALILIDQAAVDFRQAVDGRGIRLASCRRCMAAPCVSSQSRHR
jgi:hypothetical protein